MKKILVFCILSLFLLGCNKQDKTTPDTITSEIPAFEISTKISHHDIKFRGIKLKSNKSNILEIMGKPDSIVEPKYECGAFSEDWVGIPFYQYFYDRMNFIVFEEKGEIENIEFIDDTEIEMNGIKMNNEMTFKEISRLLKIKTPSDNPSKNQIILYPKEKLDENYILEFKKDKLYKFDRFDPC